MKSLKLTLALVAFLMVASAAYVAQQVDKSGPSMTAAAEAYVKTLTADQKKQGIYDFNDAERFDWNFVPLQDKMKKPTRKGLPLYAMTPDQKKAALALVKAGTSEAGNLTATTIMSLEGILNKQEAKKPNNIRNPEWYFFTVFGTPSKTGKWGWRVEGHHLSLNFTMEGNQVVASTPCFFGANPAEVKGGPDKGKRILPQVEDFARNLFKSLDESQKKVALQKEQFAEPGQKTKTPNVKPVGLTAAQMTNEQRKALQKLIKSYTDRMPPDIAALEIKQVEAGGLDKVTFGFAGETEPGKKYSYRVQGPSFVIEFLNIQADSAGNPANHIHSCWRRIEGDFGL